MGNIVKTETTAPVPNTPLAVLPEYRSAHPKVDAVALLRNAQTVEDEAKAIYRTVLEWLANGRLAEQPPTPGVLPAEVFAQWCKSRLGTANEFDIRDRLKLFVAFAEVAIQDRLRKTAVEAERATDDEE
jgi:3-hydroxymyristoyl/3-hydroxydecanoyl-(acyl carrier protein) dehydratase